MSNKNEHIRNWLDSVDPNDYVVSDEEEPCPSIVESSILETSSSSESGDELPLGVSTNNIQKTDFNNIIPQVPALTFNNVNISNSSNVYLGNIYSVNGNLNINVINKDDEPQEEETNITAKKSPVERPACLIFPRYRWLAMDPLTEPQTMPEPVEFVVIGYTATTSSEVQARNIGIIRDYQTLNVEAQGYNDIIYNFLIGCDGTIYEGRGWGVEGDHTEGYNHKSIGVAFVGNFKRELPPERAFKACRNLCIRGVAEGHLSQDYKLITVCPNPSDTNSNVLYQELKKWEHFCDIQNENES